VVNVINGQWGFVAAAPTGYTQSVASARALFDGSVIDAVDRRRAFHTRELVHA